MRSEQQIESARGGRRRMDVHACRPEAVFGDVPWGRDRIDEVGNKTKQVHEEKSEGQRLHHLVAAPEEEKEGQYEVLADKDQVGEPTGEIEGGPVVLEEPLVGRSATDPKPGALELVGSRHVHAAIDPWPIEI